MNEVYEYRRSARRPAVWLAAAFVAFLVGKALVEPTPVVVTLLWGGAGAMLGWMLLANPIAGIRVDDDHLTLSAWRRPRQIPLADIDYLRMTHWTDDSHVTIVYKDGREEGTFAGDMPPASTLAHVMAERGIPVLDPALTPSDDSPGPASATPVPALRLWRPAR